MKKSKIFMSFILAFAILVTQVGGVFAAPALQGSTPITGMVQSITLETDTVTGVTTVIVAVSAGGTTQNVRVSLETAITLGLVLLTGDGNPAINEAELGQSIEIDAAAVIPVQQEAQHPVGTALATFFSDILDYDAIMSAHDEGVGFGVIAQALWLTRKLDGDINVFLEILKAKETGDFNAFAIVNEDGTTTIPKNWGQFRKAILNNKHVNLGSIMSDKNNNGNSNGNGNGNGNGNNRDKNKDKDKDKDKGKNK